ncbi:molybdate ABC transporter substrate-binding protein [Terasakiispira papahanaumokuakeensis]|uniref:Molybdate ABC transporter substrate-binding protein n=1 Tax=Terasakiispira papahanaumokuakeensis TaxID=197479 RepID=A0A1E2VA11_9GAMM|nr:molybdate ABC transporter substrate-binding protein [Terasakiispira papahanaumokuakeensis]ODC03666.1 molybdate ABC transporter substrate-binding protein [Terasakiispira papahanaumokuakeensis]
MRRCGHQVNRLINPRLITLCLTALLLFTSVTSWANSRIQVAVSPEFEQPIRALLQEYRQQQPSTITEVLVIPTKDFRNNLRSGTQNEVAFYIGFTLKEGLKLVQRGNADEVRQFVDGQLALWAPQESARDLDVLLLQDRLITLPDPTVSPYGQAALEALNAAGLKSRLSKRLVEAPTLKDNALFIRLGDVGAGFFNYRELLSMQVAPARDVLRIPQRMYQPIHYSMILLNQSNRDRAVQRLVRYLTSEDARPALLQAGYL